MKNYVDKKVRTDATRTLLQVTSETVRDWQKLDFTNANDGFLLRAICNKTRRAALQFDSNLFFVVIFGPLKAGKSTLTNALAGEYVSPTGFGKETTRRPSIVVNDDKILNDEGGEIDQYFHCDPEPDSDPQKKATRSAFDSVTDYLRELISLDELGQRRIEKKTWKLTPANLEEKLVAKTDDREPLITVIRVRGGHLLQNQVAIVDMPGLDGSKTNWRDDPIHGWVLDQADFYLFVQSSIAALNNETRKFLKDVVGNRKYPPIRVIQNLIRAKFWQPDERQNKEADEQRAEAAKGVMEILDMPATKQPPVSALNLGLAWDGKGEKNYEWVKMSQFTPFEEELADFLHQERSIIKETNSLGDLAKVLNESPAEMKSCEAKATEILAGHQTFRQTIETAQKLVDKIDYRSHHCLESVRNELTNLASAAQDEWRKRLTTDKEQLEHFLNRDMEYTSANDEFRRLSEKLSALGDAQFFSRTSLLPKYQEIANDNCKSAENSNDELTQVKDLLKSIGLELPMRPPQPSIKVLPQIVSSPFTVSKLEGHAWYNPMSWFKAKKHKGGVIKDFLGDNLKIWNQEVEKRKETWLAGLISEHFTNYCEQRRTYYRLFLDQALAEFEKVKLEEAKRAQAAKALIRVLETDIAKLSQFCAAALSSMRQGASA